MNFSDVLLHLGEGDTLAYLPGSPPIYQTSNFLFKNVADMRAALEAEDKVPFYTRGTNPTVTLLQKKLAALENMEASLVFASGSAAISAAVLSNVKQGDHVLCVTKPYSWTAKLLVNLLSKFGVTHTLAEATSVDEFISHLNTNTKLVYLESPNSWTFEMQDIEAITAVCQSKNIVTVIDNSYASPLNQQPENYGVDIVVHSATKFIGGHSDVVAGVACASESMIQKIFKSEYMTLGGIISPFDAWLLLRSLRTLPLRLKHIGETTLKVVRAIENHPKISRIFYPHSISYTQPELAKKYLKAPGGLFTIDLNTKEVDKIEAFCNALKYFKLGCSWGSFESLAFPAITTVSSLNYNNPSIVIERVRLSVGLDDPELLINDLNTALKDI